MEWGRGFFFVPVKGTVSKFVSGSEPETGHSIQEGRMELDKKTYIRIVTHTLKSMVELSKEEKEYSLGLDLIHYYKTEIEPKNIITEAEFKSLCGDVGINLV